MKKGISISITSPIFKNRDRCHIYGYLPTKIMKRSYVGRYPYYVFDIKNKGENSVYYSLEIEKETL